MFSVFSVVVFSCWKAHFAARRRRSQPPQPSNPAPQLNRTSDDGSGAAVGAMSAVPWIVGSTVRVEFGLTDEVTVQTV